MELTKLYDLIFRDEDTAENELMQLCMSRQPAMEIALYRQKIRRRFLKSSSLDGILANNFRRSIEILEKAGSSEVLQRFVGSKTFADVHDIPGFAFEKPLSECFYNYLLSIGPVDDEQFRDRLLMDFHQGILIEAITSPSSTWIDRFPKLDLAAESGPRIEFQTNLGRYVIVSKGSKLVKFQVVERSE